jgi:hypothetical protein
MEVQKDIKVTVIGSSRADHHRDEIAKRIGQILGRMEVLLITGGRSGVMGAVSEGHHLENGFSIGILPGTDHSDANPWNSINIPSGVGYARNLTNVLAGDLVIVVGGSVGTLTELGYAIQFQKPILMLSFLKGVSSIPEQTLEDIRPGCDITYLHQEETFEEDVEVWIMSKLNQLSARS